MQTKYFFSSLFNKTSRFRDSLPACIFYKIVLFLKANLIKKIFQDVREL